MVGGVLSPTHDAYEKSSLIPATHRLEMARLTHTNFMERCRGGGRGAKDEPLLRIA